MKLALILCSLTSAAALADQAIPAPYEKERYKDMFDSSPFVLATPPETKDDVPKDSPFNNVFITSMSLSRDGRPVVYIKRPGDDQGIKLVGEEPHLDSGFTVTKVNWGDGWKNATIIAKHTNGESKEIKFSEFQPAAAAMPPGGPGGPGRGPRNAMGSLPPGAPGTITPGVNPAVTVPKVGGNNVPAPAVPRPGSAMAVPRPGGGAVLPAGSPGTMSPVTGESRTRVRGPIGNGNGGGGNNNTGGGRGQGNNYNRR